MVFVFVGPPVPKTLSLQFQGVGWYDWDEVLNYPQNVLSSKNATYIINRTIFCVLFVQGICQLRQFFVFYLY